MWKKIFIIAGIIILASWNALALEMVCDEEMKKETGVFEGDFLFTGQELDLSGEVEDLYFFGNKLDFGGKTRLGLFAFGKSIDVNGFVENGLTSAGEKVNVKGDIKGTTFLAGKEITVEDDSVIEGSVFMAAANVNIRGRIDGNLYIAAGNVNIKGTVNGDITVYTGKFNIENEVNGNIEAKIGRMSISDKGFVNGALTYLSENKLSTQELEKVKGDVKFEEKEFKIKPPTFPSYLMKTLFRVALVIAGLLLLLIPATRSLETKRLPETFWFGSLWGLIPFFMYPSAIILSILFIVTIPLAGLLLLGYMPVLFVTSVFGMTLLGQYLSTIFKWNINSRHIFFLMGALCYILLCFIPYICILLLIFFSSLGWSYLLTPLLRKKRGVNGSASLAQDLVM